MAPLSLQLTAPPADGGAAGPEEKHARSRRTLGDIGNLVTAPPVGIQLTSLRSQFTITLAATKNTVAPRLSEPSATSKPARENRVGRTGSNENKKPSKRAVKEPSGDVKSLEARLGVAESELAQEKRKVRVGVELIGKKDLLVHAMKKKQRTYQESIHNKDLKINELHALNGILRNKIGTSKLALTRLGAKLQGKEAELQQVKAQKESTLKENVKLNSKVDKKEAQFQALREQLKFMALDHAN